MSKPAKSPDHDAIRMQLPWYLNGTLTDGEASAIKAHLEGCQECCDDLSIHEQMRAAVTQDEATPIVPVARADFLIDGFLSRNSRAMVPVRRRMYAAAAAIVFALLIATMSFRTDPGVTDQNTEFTTATTADDASEMGYVLRMQFERGISQNDRDRVTRELGGTGIRELEDPDTYEILVHLLTPSLGELERFANEARARPEVKSAEFVALQLPVR